MNREQKIDLLHQLENGLITLEKFKSILRPDSAVFIYKDGDTPLSFFTEKTRCAIEKATGDAGINYDLLPDKAIKEIIKVSRTDEVKEECKLYRLSDSSDSKEWMTKKEMEEYVKNFKTVLFLPYNGRD